MSIISARSSNPAFYTDDFFTLDIVYAQRSTKIDMHLSTSFVTTQPLPQTYTLLTEHLPSILMSKCFNDENLPFAIEVKQTEIGHLFEHILLEYMCQLKMLKGYDNATYSGRTYWNWVRDPKGTFHIVVKSGVKDADIFPVAIDKSIQLLKTILNSIQPAATTSISIMPINYPINTRQADSSGLPAWQ